MKWQSDFNNEVLLTRGCFVKVRSHRLSRLSHWKAWQQSSDRGLVNGRQAEQLYKHWLVFTFTAESMVQLQAESHLSQAGDSNAIHRKEGVDSFWCCEQWPEEELCCYAAQRIWFPERETLHTDTSIWNWMTRDGLQTRARQTPVNPYRGGE